MARARAPHIMPVGSVKKKPSVKMKLNSPHSHQHDESMHDRTGSSAENDALDKALIEVAAAKIAGGRGAARTEAGTDTEQMEQQNPHERGWRPEKINAKTGQESPPDTRSPRPRSPVQRTPRTPPSSELRAPKTVSRAIDIGLRGEAPPPLCSELRTPPRVANSALPPVQRTPRTPVFSVAKGTHFRAAIRAPLAANRATHQPECGELHLTNEALANIASNSNAAIQRIAAACIKGGNRSSNPSPLPIGSTCCEYR